MYFFIQHIATTTGTLSVLQIPVELEGWNMAVLDSLLKHRDIERDSFDFKGRDLKKQRLEIHLCAMANTFTGILALGIDEPSLASPTAIFTSTLIDSISEC